MLIYHIAQLSEWTRAKEQGFYSTATFKIDGYIRCLLREQILDMAQEYFLHIKDLLLLEISEMNVIPKIGYKKFNGKEFPHVYGPLNLNSVIGDHPFQQTNNGAFELPVGLCEI